MKKLIQLEPNDWPKFQEQLKNLHLVEIYQTETQTQLKEVTTNKENSNEIIKEKKTDIKSATQTGTAPPKNTKSSTKQKSHRSPISWRKIVKDRQVKTTQTKTRSSH